jgi:hypothetical protein
MWNSWHTLLFICTLCAVLFMMSPVHYLKRFLPEQSQGVSENRATFNEHSMVHKHISDSNEFKELNCSECTDVPNGFLMTLHHPMVLICIRYTILTQTLLTDIHVLQGTLFVKLVTKISYGLNTNYFSSVFRWTCSIMKQVFWNRNWNLSELSWFTNTIYCDREHRLTPGFTVYCLYHIIT